MTEHTVYLVMCGITRDTSAEFDTEFAAVDAALEHDRIHHCTPWVQYPLEHVHTEDA